MTRYAVGLDLALVRDYSAITVLQRRKPEPGERRPIWAAIHAERLPLGTSHPDIIAHVADVLGALPGVTNIRRRDVRQPFVLAVDATGVGRPIFHELVRTVPTAVGVVITGGQEVHGTDSMLTVPKVDLVAEAQIALQHHRLTIDRHLSHAGMLANELLAFEARPTAAGNLTYSAREQEHDDLVLALCLALWLGNRESVTYRTELHLPRRPVPEISATNLHR